MRKQWRNENRYRQPNEKNVSSELSLSTETRRCHLLFAWEQSNKKCNSKNNHMQAPLLPSWIRTRSRNVVWHSLNRRRTLPFKTHTTHMYRLNESLKIVLLSSWFHYVFLLVSRMSFHTFLDAYAESVLFFYLRLIYKHASYPVGGDDITAFAKFVSINHKSRLRIWISFWFIQTSSQMNRANVCLLLPIVTYWRS